MGATHRRVKHICNHDINDGMGRGRYHSNKPCDIIMMYPGGIMQSQSVQSNIEQNGDNFKKRKGKAHYSSH